MIGSTIAQYEIVGLLGQGGMGVVYEARDLRLRRSVAIKAIPAEKLVDEDRKRRFLNEARAASSLLHPGIVTIHDLLNEGEQDYLVMELVQGESLRQRIPPEGLPWAEAVHCAAEVAAAMAAAHAAGIVHRDLNPNNLMITNQGKVKVLDFGVAKLDPEKDPDSSATQTASAHGTTVGTVAYMSPEQALGEPVDGRSDVFSLGVVLYEMLAGRRPFAGINLAALLHELHYGTPEPLTVLRPELPEALCLVVGKALAKHPDQRYQSMEVLRDELHRCGGSPEVMATPTTSALEPGTVQRNKPWPRQAPRILGLALALLALFVGAWMMGSESRTDPPAVAESDPYALYQQATAWLERYDKKGYLEQAVTAFQRLVRLDESSASGHAGLARAYWRTYLENSNDPQLLRQAEAVAHKAVELDGHLADARVSLGLVLVARGRYEDAARELEQALVLDPSLGAAWRGLAEIFREQGDMAGAEDAYKKALDLEPGDRELYDLLGSVYFADGRYDKAESVISRGIELAPDGPYGYRNLSGVYHAQGRYAEAATLLQKALAIQPKSSLYSNLGTIFFYQGLYQQSVTAFENALELPKGANDHRLWRNLGDAYRFTPDNEDKARTAFLRAIQLLRAELESKPGHADLQSQLALCLAKRGDQAEALALLEALGSEESQGEPTAPVLFRTLLTLEIAGRRDQALEALAHWLAAGYPPGAIQDEPELLNLRSDPRYHTTVAELAPE